MIISEHPELYWLTLSAIATGLMWVPHILQLMSQEGVVRAVYDPAREAPHDAKWAQRARRAHGNAIENLAIFAPLAILVAISDSGTSFTAIAAAVFFFARLGHFVAYALAIPVIRVLLFCIGWACQMVLGLSLLGML